MYSDIKIGNNVQDSIKAGVDALANAVKVTLGPKGRNVLILDQDDQHHITKDGVTVAKSIQLKDEFENIGCRLLKEVAIKTADETGDATTTSIVLANKIYNTGSKYINENNLNPILFKNYMEFYLSKVKDFIKNQAIFINDNLDKIYNVATISANNDTSIGKLAADAVMKALNSGIITIETSNNSESFIEESNGFKLNNGVISHYFMNNKVKLSCNYDNPYILIYDKKIESIKSIMHIIDICISENKPLIIIASGFDDNLIGTLITNQTRGTIKICPIKCSEFGKTRTDILEDLAIITGGTFIREELGHNLKNVNTSHLGTCDKFISDKTSSTFINGKGNVVKLNNRINELKHTILQNSEDIQTEIIKKRLAVLAGSAITIKLGANSESELNEKKDRLDDAICATRCALEEGIIPGAGSTYIRAISYLQDNFINRYENKEQESAFNTILIALAEPFLQICKNAGINGFDLMDNHSESNVIGYNLITNEFTNLIESGVIDPVKSQRLALENAINITSLFLTTDCIVVNKI